MQLTIVGTGAMACLFGARLAPVAQVVLTGSWIEAVAAIRDSGIVVEEDGKRTTASLTAIPWSAAIEPADLALILVKAWQTEEVALHLERLLKPEGVALTLQNGLGNLEALGPRACLGVTYSGATLLGPGRVQPGGMGSTWIAGPEWIVQLFRRAGMEAERGAPDQIDGLLWGKLVVNCGINALTALLRVPNGELLQRPDAAYLMERAALECADVAGAKGVDLPFADPAEKVREVARLTATNRSSMLQDVLRGAPTECEAIHGAVAGWGKRLGVPTPVNEVLFRLVRASVTR
ncbi:MAG: ketopantoate reductase family protein [Acidobacteriia bacterium]|nr:ketopantoate reductase family protein [Terriglobia bacterium]